MRFHWSFFFALVAITLFIVVPVQATVWDFEISLDGPQAGTASPGTGFGTATYDDVAAGTNFSWDITYGGLLGTPTLAHFHGPADIGVGAGVQVGTGIGDGSSIVGSATISAAQGLQLLDEKWYHNIHTTFNGAGEIRGQVLLIPEPATAAMLSIGLAALVGARRSRWLRRRRE